MKNAIKNLKKRFNQDVQDTSPESPELERRDQVVVLGAHLAGAKYVVNKVNEHLDESSQNTVYCRDVALIDDAIFGTNPENPSKERTIPSGVVLLPTMRQYDMDGRGMTIHTGLDGDSNYRTVLDYVSEICTQYGIPLEIMEDPRVEISQSFLGRIASMHSGE